jgi:serine/threonine protein kinase
MTQEQWQRVEAIFQEAVEIPADRRGDYLSAVCGADDGLRAEVESLIENQCGDEGIAQVVSDAAASLESQQTASDVGLTLGPYHLAREIGAGGMGTVYLGVRTDDEYLQAVAVKLLRPGMYSPYLLSRFRYERQILATLQHPNIARLIDGGTAPDGRPYFVMEYVEGLPIVEFCERHEWSLTKRLDLFRQVCAAVQHAHQKLVIHRDIKPCNILVSDDGEPKLLDFGIAKLLVPELAPEGVRTTISFRMMTPEYGSPEQLRCEPVTTATDVYSLGIVLYELLTAKRPYALTGRTPAEIERLVCGQEPLKPSEMADERQAKALKGDLDNIVMMAIRKEPERRYQSVEQFSQDILRYLRAKPVLARKDTFFYRAGKFAKRNRVTLAAGLVAASSLIGGTIVSVWQARRAEERFQQVRQLAGSFLFEFHDELRTLPGSTRLREKVVRTALTYLDSLAVDAQNEESLARELANAYERIGDAQGGTNSANLGQTAAALASYQKSLAMRERLASRNSSDSKLLSSLAMGHYKVGDLTWTVGNEARAAEHFRKGLQIGERLQAQNERDRDSVAVLTGGYNRLGDSLMRAQRIREALDVWSKGLAIAKRQIELGNNIQRTYTLVEVRIGEAHHKLGELEKARKAFENSLEIRRGLAVSGQDRARRDLMVVYHHLANLYGSPSSLNFGDTATAIQYLDQAAGICREFAAADPGNAEAQLDLSITTWKQGSILLDVDPPGAAKKFREAVEVARQLATASPESVPFRNQYALSLASLGKADLRLGNTDAALSSAEHAIRLYEREADPREINDYVDALTTRGDTLAAAQQDVAARVAYEKALNRAERAAAASPSNLLVRRELATVYEHMGRYFMRRQQPDCAQASMWFEKAAGVWLGWSTFGESTAYDKQRLASVLKASEGCRLTARASSILPP